MSEKDLLEELRAMLRPLAESGGKAPVGDFTPTITIGLPMYHRVLWALDKAERLEVEDKKLRAALEGLLEAHEEPPPGNCSCHLSPPCRDCVEWLHIREAREDARAALGETK